MINEEIGKASRVYSSLEVACVEACQYKVTAHLNKSELDDGWQVNPQVDWVEVLFLLFGLHCAATTLKCRGDIRNLKNAHSPLKDHNIFQFDPNVRLKGEIWTMDKIIILLVVHHSWDVDVIIWTK